MSKIAYIFGGPGCGKSTYLGGRMVYMFKQGYKADRFIAISFSKAAAKRLGDQARTELVAVPAEQIGTLHAQAWRAIGRPDVVYNVEHIEKWNELNPALIINLNHIIDVREDRDGKISGATRQRTKGECKGNVLLERYDLLRGKEVEEERWDPELVDFAEAWEEFKGERSLVDFTDMVDLAIRDDADPPGEAVVGFFDEAQDFSPLEARLVRLWSEKLEFSYIAGDDDQTIYAFKGANPDWLIEAMKHPEKVKILDHSYRLPRRIQAYANDWIQALAKRVPKQFGARDEEGVVREEPSYRYSNPLILLPELEEQVAQGRTVMLLATCRDMLASLLYTLRKRGLPFWNPYALKRGEWNPLRMGPGSTSQRVVCYLAASREHHGEQALNWTYWQWWRFMDMLIAKDLFQRGAKDLARSYAALEQTQHDPVNEDFMREVFTPEGWAEFQENYPDLNWLHAKATKQFYTRLKFPILIVQERGLEGLSQDPKIIIGTIHSVKGGEADVVYLFPDIGYAAHMAKRISVDEQQAEIRQFYVGMTRAREELILCGASDQYRVMWL